MLTSGMRSAALSRTAAQKCLDMIDPEIDDTIAKFNVCADCYDDTMRELP